MEPLLFFAEVLSFLSSICHAVVPASRTVSSTKMNKTEIIYELTMDSPLSRLKSAEVCGIVTAGIE
jgi:cytochrome c biogenesis protein CcdA